MIPEIDIYCDSTTRAGGIWIPTIEKGYMIPYTTKVTVNEGEYLAMLTTLEMAKSLLMDTRCINIYSDSQLVVKSLTCGWRLHKDRLKELHRRCAAIYAQIAVHNVHISWIPREQNEMADKLSKGKYEGEIL